MPKIKGGYILQPRKFDGSKASKMSPVTRELWFYLLRNVNHSPHNGLLAGQKFFRFSDIQEELSWYVGYRKMVYSKPQLTKALRRLCEGNMTATMKATHGIIITVCNYSKYQNPKNYEGNDEGSTKDQRRKSAGHNIYKNGKELKELNKEHAQIIASFEKFWELYDRKKDRKRCLSKWLRLKQQDIDVIFETLPDYIRATPNKQFRKFPATYLNNRSWENEIDEIDNNKEIEEWANS